MPTISLCCSKTYNITIARFNAGYTDLGRPGAFLLTVKAVATAMAQFRVVAGLLGLEYKVRLWKIWGLSLVPSAWTPLISPVLMKDSRIVDARFSVPAPVFGSGELAIGCYWWTLKVLLRQAFELGIMLNRSN